MAWTAVALWVGVIGSMSSDAFSSDQTGGVFDDFLNWIGPGLDPATLNAVNFAIRKAAHFTEYAILALLTCRALRVSTQLPPRRLAKWAMGMVGVVAGMDEIRQTFSLVRTGTIGDVAIDLAGGFAAIALYIIWHRAHQPPPATRSKA